MSIKKLFIITILVISPVNTLFGYEYNGNSYNITIPENIEKMEYCYNSNQCEISEYGKKIVHLNMLLIKHSFPPLY